MRIFHMNAALAKSRFWYFLKQQKKIRGSQGEIVNVSEIYEKKTGAVHNYGMVIRYLSRTGIVNMYKEYRDVTASGAVSQMYQEMASRHRAKMDTIHIVSLTTVADKDVKRAKNVAYATADVKYPKVITLPRAPLKSMKTLFKATKPLTYLA